VRSNDLIKQITTMNYINPYSDAFTQRLIRAKEKRDRLKEAYAHDIVLARRNSGN
jgi:hypothetical protein